MIPPSKSGINNYIMNKLTLILQDKSVIAELAKDEEVKIRIADAVIDGVRKRSSKIMDGISDSISREIASQIYERNSWSKALKPEIKVAIAKEAIEVVKDLVKEETKPLREEAIEKLREIRVDLIKALDCIDLEKLVEKQVRIIIREKFKL